MKIGIIDADLLDNGSKHPNLALLKISGYNKAIGHDVELLHDYDSIKDYDKVYMSKVFNFTEIPINLEDYDNLEIGGTGFFEDGGESLPHEIEHHMPDYSLYDEYIDKQIEEGARPVRYRDYKEYSIGFMTRGCFRKCDFCVNKKYDRVHKHSSLKEFLDVGRQRIYLWDDNFMAYSGWRESLDELEESGKYFQFRQGLDIRLMTEEKAERLSSMKYYGDYIFAFDHIEDRELIEEKLALWKRYCTKTTKLYVLCGFDKEGKYDNEFWLRDIVGVMKRLEVLMKYQCLPYIMRFERYEESPYRGVYITLARWCNQPNMFKKLSLYEYLKVDLKSSKIKSGETAAMRYIQEFKERHPEIAEKYFNIKLLDYTEEV